MGKIRIKTLGDETTEKKQKQDSKKRTEAKKAEKEAMASPVIASEAPYRMVQGEAKQSLSNEENKKDETTGSFGITASPLAPRNDTKPSTEKTAKPGKKRAAKKAIDRRSENYKTKASLVDKKKVYLLNDALSLLPKLNLASFDETIELHINTTASGISGNIILPHGTGKQIRVKILNPTDDSKHVDEVIKKIESGVIDFDILIATPDSMPQLAKVAKFLGPKGLMPNPKNGTLSTKPADVAKKYAGGQIHYKTEAKFPLLHLQVGKMSFGEKKLAENIKAFLKAIDNNNIKNVTLKSTMSPGIKLDFTTV